MKPPADTKEGLSGEEKKKVTSPGPGPGPGPGLMIKTGGEVR